MIQSVDPREASFRLSYLLIWSSVADVLLWVSLQRSNKNQRALTLPVCFTRGAIFTSKWKWHRFSVGIIKGKSVIFKKRENKVSHIYCAVFMGNNVATFGRELNISYLEVLLANNRIIWAWRGDCVDVFQHSVILDGQGLSSEWSVYHPCAGAHCVNGSFATHSMFSLCLRSVPPLLHLVITFCITQSALCLSANSSDVQREPRHSASLRLFL